MATKVEALITQVERVSRESEEAAAADAGFDAGEFSGPAHAEAFEVRLASLIAAADLSADEKRDFDRWMAGDVEGMPS